MGTTMQLFSVHATLSDRETVLGTTFGAFFTPYQGASRALADFKTNTTQHEQTQYTTTDSTQYPQITAHSTHNTQHTCTPYHFQCHTTTHAGFSGFPTTTLTAHCSVSLPFSSRLLCLCLCMFRDLQSVLRESTRVHTRKEVNSA